LNVKRKAIDFTYNAYDAGRVNTKYNLAKTMGGASYAD